MGYKVKKVLFLLALLLAITLTIASCGSSIVGTWSNSLMGLDTTIQFNNDGTFSISALGILAASGTYSVSGNQVTLTLSQAVAGMNFTAGTSSFTISGDQLVIDGLVYTRQK